MSVPSKRCTIHTEQVYVGHHCPLCQAIHDRLVRRISIGNLYARYDELKLEPDKMTQDAYGVCGMASIVYLLLKHWPKRADELFKATFCDLINIDLININLETSGGVVVETTYEFRTADNAVIYVDFSNLSRKYMVRKIADAQKRTTDEELLDVINSEDTFYFVDYCMARALGYIFKRVARTRYVEEKSDFNKYFGPENSDSAAAHFTQRGNLALRTNNLAFILKHIVGANVGIISQGHFLKVWAPEAGGVSTIGFNYFPNLNALGTKINSWLSTPKGFVLAAIWQKLLESDSGYPQVSIPATVVMKKASLTYDHWVVINRFTVNSDNNNTVTLEIWTYGKNYTLTGNWDVLQTYIEELVGGYFY